MGLMRFLVPPPARLSAHAAEHAYLTGLDQIPWRTRSRLVGDTLHLERDVSDSGNLHVAYQVPGHHETVLSTASLMERPRPYLLPVELARGRIHQLRNQLVEWQSVGLQAPSAVTRGLRDALAHFARAATSQQSPAQATAEANLALAAALTACRELVSSYTDQVIAYRIRQAGPLPTQFGACLERQPMDRSLAGRFLAAFNTAVVPMAWRDVESIEGMYDWAATDHQIRWCRGHGLSVCGGPLIPLGGHGLPDWLYLWEGNFDSVLSFVSDYVETAAMRYRGKTQLWLCASRVNVSQALSLSEEENLRLAVRALEIIRQVDSQTPAVILFDQPWAEYMGREDRDLSPLHFADALVRSGLPLGGIGLEINVGYTPHGTLPRDALDFGRLIDIWSSLGLPLYIFLTYPTSSESDPQAIGESRPLQLLDQECWSAGGQRRWVKQVVPALLAKPSVAGIIWNQLADGERHEFPHGGLVEANGDPKPAFRSLANLRRKHLQPPT